MWGGRSYGSSKYAGRNGPVAHVVAAVRNVLLLLANRTFQLRAYPRSYTLLATATGNAVRLAPRSFPMPQFERSFTLKLTDV